MPTKKKAVDLANLSDGDLVDGFHAMKARVKALTSQAEAMKVEITRRMKKPPTATRARMLKGSAISATWMQEPWRWVDQKNLRADAEKKITLRKYLLEGTRNVMITAPSGENAKDVRQKQSEMHSPKKAAKKRPRL